MPKYSSEAAATHKTQTTFRHCLEAVRKVKSFVILGLDPGIHAVCLTWIPAFAGMTILMIFLFSDSLSEWHSDAGSCRSPAGIFVTTTARKGGGK